MNILVFTASAILSLPKQLVVVYIGVVLKDNGTSELYILPYGEPSAVASREGGGKDAWQGTGRHLIPPLPSVPTVPEATAYEL